MASNIYTSRALGNCEKTKKIIMKKEIKEITEEVFSMAVGRKVIPEVDAAQLLAISSHIERYTDKILSEKK